MVPLEATNLLTIILQIPVYIYSLIQTTKPIL